MHQNKTRRKNSSLIFEPKMTAEPQRKIVRMFVQSVRFRTKNSSIIVDLKDVENLDNSIFINFWILKPINIVARLKFEAFSFFVIWLQMCQFLVNHCTPNFFLVGNSPIPKESK